MDIVAIITRASLPNPVSFSADIRDIAWRFLVAVGAGSLIGAAIGGVGGRLVMLALRVGSDLSVRGVDTDDGFEIGRFTTATGFLMTVTAGLGGASGVVYLIVRDGLPLRLRAVTWGVFLALLTGADILQPTGLDFTILDPKPLAVLSFIALPGFAAFAIAVGVERLLAVRPWSGRSLTAVLGVGSLPLLPVVPAILLLAGAALAARRITALNTAVHTIGRLLVPVAVTLLAVRSGFEVWSDTREILSP